MRLVSFNIPAIKTSCYTTTVCIRASYMQQNQLRIVSKKWKVARHDDTHLRLLQRCCRNRAHKLFSVFSRDRTRNNMLKLRHRHLMLQITKGCLQQQQLGATANCLDKPRQLLSISWQTHYEMFRQSWGREGCLSQSLPHPLQKGIKIPESFDFYMRFTSVFTVYLWRSVLQRGGE